MNSAFISVVLWGGVCVFLRFVLFGDGPLERVSRGGVKSRALRVGV